MYDIEELERRWLKYSRKRLLKHVGLGMGVLVLIATPILYVTLRPGVLVPKRTHESLEVNNSTEGNLSQTKKLVQKEEALKPVVSSVESSKPKMLITLSDPGTQNSGKSAETEAEKKIRLEMTDTRNAQVVKEIEARFPATRDYDDAMYLAKYYYGKKNYRKAEYWAMQANAIDSTQEESWIVFGKAKARQGHRADALRVLQAYYERSGSMRVKDLIYRIRKGKKY